MEAARPGSLRRAATAPSALALPPGISKPPAERAPTAGGWAGRDGHRGSDPPPGGGGFVSSHGWVQPRRSPLLRPRTTRRPSDTEELKGFPARYSPSCPRGLGRGELRARSRATLGASPATERRAAAPPRRSRAPAQPSPAQPLRSLRSAGTRGRGEEADGSPSSKPAPPPPA
ncbi:mucin-1-like [Sarcophilus harrisii]|uniref:mucin-1-like n=1 Tax=Sarcophilus harrisii TaxID=9305 RepID=UPI001301F71C|nr:mucin-1-like [Sarcophilus harrisii]